MLCKFRYDDDDWAPVPPPVEVEDGWGKAPSQQGGSRDLFRGDSSGVGMAGDSRPDWVSAPRQTAGRAGREEGLQEEVGTGDLLPRGQAPYGSE